MANGLRGNRYEADVDLFNDGILQESERAQENRVPSDVGFVKKPKHELAESSEATEVLKEEHEVMGMEPQQQLEPAL